MDAAAVFLAANAAIVFIALSAADDTAAPLFCCEDDEADEDDAGEALGFDAELLLFDAAPVGGLPLLLEAGCEELRADEPPGGEEVTEEGP